MDLVNNQHTHAQYPCKLGHHRKKVIFIDTTFYILIPISCIDNFIHDVEKVLDEFIFLKEGRIVMHDCTDNVRETEGRSLDELFREVFKC